MQRGFQLAVKNKSEFRLYIYTYIHTYIQNDLVAAHNSALPGI